jgi:hypothetical protein
MVLLLPLMAQAGTGFPGYWIGTHATGNLFTNATHYSGGTSNNPFDGSTEAKFDFIMSNMPPNTVIHLQPGTFQTLGGITGYTGWTAKPGQSILGSGVGITIIQHPAWQVTNHALMDKHYLITSQAPWITSICGNVDLENFTADCNYYASNHIAGDYAAVNGICLAGASNTVKNVQVMNMAAYGSNTNNFREVFGIVITQDTGSSNNGNLIQNCQFNNFSANATCDAVAIFIESSGEMINNIVTQNGASSVFAFCVIGPGRIAGNEAYNCSVFIHMDNSSTCFTNVVVESNMVVNVDAALDLYNGRMSNILFRNNTVIVTNHVNYGTAVNSLLPKSSDTPSITNSYNITLSGNTFSAASASLSNLTFLRATGAIGLNILSNVIPANFSNMILNGTNVVISGNVDAGGNYLRMNDPPYTVSYLGNGSTGGSAPTDPDNPYPSGATVTVLGNPGHLTQSGHSFAGWNTAADYSGMNFIPGVTPNSFSITGYTMLYALWMPVPVISSIK